VGYFVKNRKLQSGSSSVVVPAGTSAERPDAPLYGAFRYNTSIGRLEYFNGTAFKTVSISGEANIIVDAYTGNGVTTTFGPMSTTPSDTEQILVFVGSIYQSPAVYSVTTNDITFVSAPPTGEVINIIHNLGSTTTV
jgi:hypothetical protein